MMTDSLEILPDRSSCELALSAAIGVILKVFPSTKIFLRLCQLLVKVPVLSVMQQST